MSCKETTYDVPIDTLAGWVESQLFEAGCSAITARIIADNCVAAEAAGSASHGLFRLDGYISTLRSGWVDGEAEPVVTIQAPGHVHVDAANGFAQTALAAARADFVAVARACGIAILTIGNSHHLAALWPDITPFAEEGLVAISMVNSFSCAIPVGGNRPILGTNPFAFAAPIPGEAPFVFDFATTAMSNGDVRIAAREGRQVAPGSGVDHAGQSTTDPNAILDGGALLPFGGHKGSAISLMIELMVAGLAGGKFSSEVDWSEHPGAQTPHTGQIIILIDPAAGGTKKWAAKSTQFIAMLKAAGLESYPGQRRWNARHQETVRVPSNIYSRLDRPETQEA